MTTTEKYLELARRGFDGIDVSEELKSRALDNLDRWFRDERAAADRPQLEYLLEIENFNILFDSFFQQIPFGTGGRRGPVGLGTNRVNPFTISTSIQGHCEFLKKYAASDGTPSVVIAYDVRVFRDLRRVYDRDRPNPLIGLTSQDFARVAAEVYAANGIKVWFPNPAAKTYVSTPELSFAIRFLGAAAGLNVSASHNHPDDNGAKIYNEGGGQEIPPRDEEMAKIVEAVTEARRAHWDTAVKKERVAWIPDEVHEAYVETNVGLSLDRAARSARVVFTPLHGTGWSSVGATLQGAGFSVDQYADQAEPDGMFPNVPFRSPNPEVPESLEGASRFAEAIGADLVLAADPDADRLGMVAPDRNGRWTFLNGNEIGVLLAAYIIEHLAAAPRTNPFAITTIVTTSLFSRVLRARGVRVFNDLSIGFKYIASILRRIEEEGAFADLRASIDDYVLGIEESHGYLVTHRIRDKDAAGAALLLSELASSLKDQGRTLFDRLQDIFREHGYVRNHLTSTVMQGARGFLNIRKIQQSLRERPPASVAGQKVLRFVDRWDEKGPYGKIVSETDRASRDLLTFELEKSSRVILRPSGTESKNKIYVEVCGEPLGGDASDGELQAQKTAIDARAKEISRSFTLEMLSRIGVELPRWAMEVSDLVPLECKQDFADSLLPELIKRLEEGQWGEGIAAWLDGRLVPYGADGRRLVRGAVSAYCDAEQPNDATARRLRELFEIE